MKDQPYTEPKGGSYVVEDGVSKRVEGTKPPLSKLERLALAAAAQAQSDAGNSQKKGK
jgi:hypothetical protein